MSVSAEIWMRMRLSRGLRTQRWRMVGWSFDGVARSERCMVGATQGERLLAADCAQGQCERAALRAAAKRGKQKGCRDGGRRRHGGAWTR